MGYRALIAAVLLAGCTAHPPIDWRPTAAQQRGRLDACYRDARILERRARQADGSPSGQEIRTFWLAALDETKAQCVMIANESIRTE